MATLLWTLAVVLVIAGSFADPRRDLARDRPDCRRSSRSPGRRQCLHLMLRSNAVWLDAAPDTTRGRVRGPACIGRAPCGKHQRVRRSEIDAGGEPPRMFEIHADSGNGVLRLVGELDAATVPQLRHRLEELPRATVLNLRDMTFIDASGLGALVLAARACDDADQLTLRAPNARVRRLLELCGLSEWFRIEPDASA